MKTPALLLLTLVIATPLQARAAEPDPRLDRFDTDGDGTIDEAERAAVRAFLQKRRQRPGAMTPSGTTDTVGDRDVTEMQYPSSDGRKISAVLSMPRGEGPFPVVVTIHGGQGDGDAASPRRTPTPGQSAAIRQLRSRIAEMPVPENLTRRTLTVGGIEREFFINVPARCAGRPSPVVFVLHGGASKSGLAMHLKSDFTTLGETAGYVTVYPSGVNGWNIGSHDMYSVKRRTSDADDVGFFRTMFDTLVAEKVADPRRIHVVGGSNGGVMTQFLVCSLADRIAGAGVLVATLPRAAEKDWPRPSRPVPMLVMLGTDDPMKPWDGNRDQMSAAETVAFWRTRNATDAKGTAWDLADRDPADGCRVRAERWEGEAPVVFYTLEGHGHGWPMQRGRDTAGTGPKTRDISAPDVLWSFFEAASPR